MSTSLDADKVEEIFDQWIEMLLAHYGDKTVREVLSSPAIQSCFTGDIGQWAVSESARTQSNEVTE